MMADDIDNTDEATVSPGKPGSEGNPDSTDRTGELASTSASPSPLDSDVHVGARNPIEEVAESFIARLRRGERPKIEAYAERYPELADEIRDLFPTLATLEHCGQSSDGFGASNSRVSQMPPQLGEYHLIGEIGRGGMGIVYEARHSTMQRRVALKVLPSRHSGNSRHLERFLREARSAGKLHHTNIVPVFEVGSDHGYHFYAMQFIQGQSLDIVFDELRELRDRTVKLGATSSTSIDHKVLEHLTQYSHTTSSSLRVTYDQDQIATQITHVPSDDSPIDHRGEGVHSNDLPLESFQSQSTTGNSSLTVFDRSSNGAGSTDAASGFSDPSFQADYFRRIARVGIQVAEALAYAHTQGLLHRDIKPSNIILDTSGAAWVTDFGLAKHEGDDLTQSGDIVGTLRYMAPERFDGHADARSDVYGLGLTLYELCTLRSAFEAKDRAQLMRTVSESVPDPPREIDAQVPKDLETIILKAIEKRPGDRYQSARHLANDLMLFIADRPIQARRTSAAERAWRWCRRNPPQAALAGCVFLLLAVLSIGSVVFGYRMADQAEQLRGSQQLANERLYDSLLGRARAARWSGRPGQHFESLDDIAEAAKLLPILNGTADETRRQRVLLRNAALAAMPLPDIRIHKSWSRGKDWNGVVTFSPDYTQYACLEPHGKIVVRSTDNDRKIQEMSPPGPGTVEQLRYSPDGNYLAAVFVNKTRGVWVWSLESELSLIVDGMPDYRSFDFDSDSARLAVTKDKTLQLYRLGDGQLLKELAFNGSVTRVAFRPRSTQVALLVRGASDVQIWDFSSEELVASLKPSGGITAFAWTKHDQIAIGCSNGKMTLHSLYGQHEARELVGHSSRITAIHPSPVASQILSESWDGTRRLWQTETGEEVLRIEGDRIANSGFRKVLGDRLGFITKDGFGCWQFARRSPLQILRSDSRETERRWSVDFDPQSRWLASARDDGVEVWDVRHARIAGFIPMERRRDGVSKDARFVGGGQQILTSACDGVSLYDFAIGTLTTGEQPRELLKFELNQKIQKLRASWVGVDSTLDLVAYRENYPGLLGVVRSLSNPSEEFAVGPHPGLDHVELSPNGQWVATTSWNGRGVGIWDVTSEKRVHQIETESQKTNAVFSPDSRLLATSTPTSQAVWRTSDWSEVFRLNRSWQDEWPGPLAFSSAGTMIAVAESRFVLKLLDSATGQVIGLLDAPSDAGFHCCRFSADGRLFAAASDSDIYLWDITLAREQLARMTLNWGSVDAVNSKVDPKTPFASVSDSEN